MEPKPLFSAMTSVQYFSPSTKVSYLHLPVLHLVLIKSTAILLLPKDLPQPSLTLAYLLPTQDCVSVTLKPDTCQNERSNLVLTLEDNWFHAH